MPLPLLSATSSRSTSSIFVVSVILVVALTTSAGEAFLYPIAPQSSMIRVVTRGGVFARNQIFFPFELRRRASLAATSTSAELLSKNKSFNENTSSSSSFVFSNASVIKVIATSRGGVASILISDESTTPMPPSVTTAATTHTPTTSLKETLFAKLDLPPIPQQQEQQQRSGPPKGAVQEVLGKRVVFISKENDNMTLEGIIIALRYPVAFVYFPSYESKLVPSTINADNSIVRVLQSSTKTRLPSITTGGPKMVDCFGNNLLETKFFTIDDTLTNNDDSEAEAIDIFSPIPKVAEIALINAPLLTGVTMIDALAPIGRGQNMLIVGEEGTGRRDIAISAIRTQLALGDKRGAFCVYAACSKPLLLDDDSANPGVMEKLKAFGVVDDVTFVSMRKSHNDGEMSDSEKEDEAVVRSAESIAIASSACSIAEYWARSHGRDSLVIVDTIDQHKAFWDYTTKALVDVYGLDAVVKEDMNGSASSEMRGFFSGLIQRSGRFNAQHGGGSVSLALLVTVPSEIKEEDITTFFGPEDFEGFNPKIQARVNAVIKQGIKITPQILSKLSIPIPPTRLSVDERKRFNSLRHVDDLISMTDGQIWLSEQLLMLDNGARRPPMDPRQSITRVGIGADTDSRADAPALRSLVGGMRFEFAQASALEGAVDVVSQRQLLERDALLLAMYQNPQHTIRTLSEECICLMTARMGLLNDAVKAGHGAGTDEGKELVDKLIAHVHHHVAPEIICNINETFELDSVSKESLELSIQSFFLL